MRMRSSGVSTQADSLHSPQGFSPEALLAMFAQTFDMNDWREGSMFGPYAKDYATFVEGVAADPKDRTRRLVFCDWLEERHGEVRWFLKRATLIRRQIEFSERCHEWTGMSPNDFRAWCLQQNYFFKAPILDQGKEKAVKELALHDSILRVYGKRWVGQELHGGFKWFFRRGATMTTEWRSTVQPVLDARFQDGFVERVTLDEPNDWLRHHKALMRNAPIREVWLPHLPRVWVHHPSQRYQEFSPLPLNIHDVMRMQKGQIATATFIDWIGPGRPMIDISENELMLCGTVADARSMAWKIIDGLLEAAWPEIEFRHGESLQTQLDLVRSLVPLTGYGKRHGYGARGAVLVIGATARTSFPSASSASPATLPSRPAA